MKAIKSTTAKIRHLGALTSRLPTAMYAIILSTVPILAITAMSTAEPVQARNCEDCEPDRGGGGGDGGGSGGGGAGSAPHDSVVETFNLFDGRIGEFWEACQFGPGDRRLFVDPAEIARLRNLGRPAQIAVFPGSGSDLVIMEVSDDTSMGVGPGETIVEFVNEVVSDKEIWAWNSCQGRLATLFQPGLQPGQTPTVNSVRLSLTRPAIFGDPGPTTLVFRKPGFFGIWMDIGHFDPDSFWGLADGKVVRFTWKLQ